MTRHTQKPPRRKSAVAGAFPYVLVLAVALLALSVMYSLAVHRAAPSAAGAYADPAFQQLWQRTDQPVSAGRAQRSWYWGPQPGEVKTEPYSGSKTGFRLVQYFDKARMEINNPDSDRNSEWFVTTGLLVAEMVAGKQQIGDREYRALGAAEIAVGGDGLETDPDAPTYTSFRPVSSLTGPGANRARNRTGQPITATINRAGKVGDSAGLGLYPGAIVSAYSDVLGHNIPKAFDDFLNLKGMVNLNGTVVDNQLLANRIFVMGYPISEPYWARVKIQGVYADVMFQMYERRSLAYIPSLQQGWQVQMGNVGAHYSRWLYGGPLPAPQVALPPSSINPPPLPAPLDAALAPTSAPVGASLSISISGFRPGEEIVSWFTAPDGTASDARINPRAGLDGAAGNLSIATAKLTPGVWAITFHGKSGAHESIGYFYLYAPDPNAPTATLTVAPQPTTTLPAGNHPSATVVPQTPTRPATPRPQGTQSATPTEPAVPTEPPAGLILAVRPGSGAPSDQFAFQATGLLPGEPVQVKFTDPSRNVVYPAGSNNGQYQADATGRLTFSIAPVQAFPAAPTGTWLFELRGAQSGLEGVTGFVLR